MVDWNLYKKALKELEKKGILIRLEETNFNLTEKGKLEREKIMILLSARK